MMNENRSAEKKTKEKAIIHLCLVRSKGDIDLGAGLQILDHIGPFKQLKYMIGNGCTLSQWQLN